MTTIYRSDDASAPVMEHSAGSLIALMKACLVDGYGALPAAGWSYTDIDVPTYQAAFTQGAAESWKTQRHLYIKDSEATVGRAEAAGCSAFTVSASPVLSDFLSSYNTSTNSVILKTAQSGGALAEWFVVANARTFLIATKRHEWGSLGWSLFLGGDYPSPFSRDKGNFSMSGRHTADTNIAPGASASTSNMDRAYVFGNVDGIYAPASISAYPSIGANSSIGSGNYGGAAGSSDILLTNRIFGASPVYRLRQPFIWLPTAPSAYFSSMALPDGYEFDAGGGLMLKFLRVEGATSERLFVEVGGFSG